MMPELREGGMLVAKIHQVAGRIFAKKLKKYGISEINPAQGRILFVLWQNDGIPIRDLSAKTMLEKSTLTSMLDRLEETGYILRVPSREDRRKILISRTEKDKAFQKRYDEVSEDMARLFYQGLSEQEINQLEAGLRKILVNLVSYEQDRNDD
jgi:DNA-binding MarR family transcriptional regulator